MSKLVFVSSKKLSEEEKAEENFIVRELQKNQQEELTPATLSYLQLCQKIKNVTEEKQKLVQAKIEAAETLKKELTAVDENKTEKWICLTHLSEEKKKELGIPLDLGYINFDPHVYEENSTTTKERKTKTMTPATLAESLHYTMPFFLKTCFQDIQNGMIKDGKSEEKDWTNPVMQTFQENLLQSTNRATNDLSHSLYGNLQEIPVFYPPPSSSSSSSSPVKRKRKSAINKKPKLVDDHSLREGKVNKKGFLIRKKKYHQNKLRFAGAPYLLSRFTETTFSDSSSSSSSSSSPFHFPAPAPAPSYYSNRNSSEYQDFFDTNNDDDEDS
jgi:hypothetical protein